MGMKITSAMAALAISSASASFVGAAYTGFVSVRFDDRGVSRLFDGFGRARLEAGIVHDTAKYEFGSTSDLPVVSGPGCRNVVGPGGCFLVFSSGELNLTFFGYTVSLPTDWWYSYVNEDDFFPVGGQGRFLKVFGKIKDIDTTINKAKDQNKNEDPNVRVGSQSYTDNVMPTTDIATHFISLIVAADYTNLNVVADDTNGKFQLPPITNGDSNPVEVEGLFIPYMTTAPTTSVPEPATWAMILIGFAGLAYAGYRRTRKASLSPPSLAMSAS
jgi:hypothetical protein